MGAHDLDRLGLADLDTVGLEVVGGSDTDPVFLAVGAALLDGGGYPAGAVGWKVDALRGEPLVGDWGAGVDGVADSVEDLSWPHVFGHVPLHLVAADWQARRRGEPTPRLLVAEPLSSTLVDERRQIEVSTDRAVGHRRKPT